MKWYVHPNKCPLGVAFPRRGWRAGREGKVKKRCSKIKKVLRKKQYAKC